MVAHDCGEQSPHAWRGQGRHPLRWVTTYEILQTLDGPHRAPKTRAEGGAVWPRAGGPDLLRELAPAHGRADARSAGRADAGCEHADGVLGFSRGHSAAARRPARGRRCGRRGLRCSVGLWPAEAAV